MENICEDLSVLMSIYYRERQEYLDLSIKSIWTNQLMKPGKIVLVEDGPLPQDLENIILKWKEIIKDRIVIVSYERNMGLAYALNTGIQYCEGDFIARMDSDDLSLPNRFLLQVDFLRKNQNIDVVGSALSEINEIGKIRNKVVKYPLTHEQCFNFFRRRDPLAHPAVMFRKRFFRKAGFYNISENAKQDEDSYLWMQGFKKGCKFENLPDVLLYYRVTNEFFDLRRGGIRYGMRIYKNRLKIIRELNYSLDSHLYALFLFVVYNLPPILKKILYRLLR